MSFQVFYTNLYYYDVYPKVVCIGKAVEITIRPLGGRCPFVPGESYEGTVKACYDGDPGVYPASGKYVSVKIDCGADGCLRLTHTFPTEQEYFIDIPYTFPNGRSGKERFRIFAVGEDLCGYYPLIGDLHIHTTGSDGLQKPEISCAYYRRFGYDFMVISDHCRFAPSLEAQRFYANVPTELCIVQGEEIHLPPESVDVPHILNFGGTYSINALIERHDYIHLEDSDTEPQNRSVDGNCPPIMTMEEFENLMHQKAAELKDLPEDLDAEIVARVRWAYEEIRRANGMSIYVHPMWISDTLHVPDALNRYIVENRLFDAFEVLGGENYIEQNGFQTVQYYEDKARGYHYPIVGSTDSHICFPYNDYYALACTMVFASENTREGIIDAVKGFRSVAIDTISKEFRLVGELRFVRYACFLLKNYFPIHDDLCFEEGRLMHQYATGSESERAEALAELQLIHGRVHRLQQKYFAI